MIATVQVHTALCPRCGQRVEVGMDEVGPSEYDWVIYSHTKDESGSICAGKYGISYLEEAHTEEYYYFHKYEDGNMPEPRVLEHLVEVKEDYEDTMSDDGTYITERAHRIIKAYPKGYELVEVQVDLDNGKILYKV